MNYINTKFESIGFECLLKINEKIIPRFVLEFYSQLEFNYNSEGHFVVNFVIQNKPFSFTLEEFGNILGIPSKDDIALVSESVEAETAHNEEVDIRIGDKILQPKESFRYLRSMIHKSGRNEEDVSHCIKTAWLKWKAASRVLCDRNIPLKLKGKFYRVAIRPFMLYGSECWPITKTLANRMEVTELRMLRWTCGKPMLDMIPNEVYRAELEVETIINKMREGRLRWFRHVRRRPQSAPVRRVEALVVDGVRRRGRLKLRWEDRVKQDLKELLLSEDMTPDRIEWGARISVGG
ncbi:hypothetical protein Tco_0711924 [Tanacetum coccineum]